MREAMLANHSEEHATLDEMIKAIANPNDAFSQFAFMYQYAWDNYRDEYNWHFEADGYMDAKFYPSGYSEDYLAAMKGEGSFLRAGTPEENGVTKKMLEPFPRVAVHASYEGGGQEDSFREHMVASFLRRGYCYSQPMNSVVVSADGDNKNVSFANDDDLAKHLLCQRYDIENSIYRYGEWNFEARVFGEMWPMYDKEGVKNAHIARLERNRPHEWDRKDLDGAFSPSTIKACEAAQQTRGVNFYQGC